MSRKSNVIVKYCDIIKVIGTINTIQGNYDYILLIEERL